MMSTSYLLLVVAALVIAATATEVLAHECNHACSREICGKRDFVPCDNGTYKFICTAGREMNFKNCTSNNTFPRPGCSDCCDAQECGKYMPTPQPYTPPPTPPCSCGDRSCCIMPHCCVVCGDCSCGGFCFQTGNCFNRCQCGTPNCPGSTFWRLLEKNVTTSGKLTAAEKGEFEAGLTQAKSENVKKEAKRIASWFLTGRH